MKHCTEPDRLGRLGFNKNFGNNVQVQVWLGHIN